MQPQCEMIENTTDPGDSSERILYAARLLTRHVQPMAHTRGPDSDEHHAPVRTPTHC